MVEVGQLVNQQRQDFFIKSGLPYWDCTYERGPKNITYPYAIFNCYKESKDIIEEIKTASVLVAEVFDKALALIKEWDTKELKKWHFNKRLYDFWSLSWDNFFCFRAGWALNDGKLKLLEINSQTPSFWCEPEKGNSLLCKKFGLQDPSPDSLKTLKESINQAITNGLSKLPGIYGSNPRVGIVTSNYHEDIVYLEWIAKFIDFETEVVGIDDFDFTKKENIPFSRKSNKLFDVILFWYPMEWAIDLKFRNGDSVWKIMIDSLKQNNFALVHAIPATLIQPKTILAFISKNSDLIFTGKLKEAKKYFPKTSLSKNDFDDTYFAKPVWGREGRGCYLVEGSNLKRSRYQQDYYVNQPMVYQELLKLHKVKIDNMSLHLIYEAWVYRVNQKFIAGGITGRGSEHPITDDYCYWLSIGL